MRLLNIVVIAMLITSPLFSQNPVYSFEWNGYGQFRFYKSSNRTQGFMVRRTKIWLKGNLPYTNNFSYKVMGIFTYNHTGYFGLLDFYGDYNFNSGYLRFGQQIPEFSLQRLQPDWKIPVIERSEVINKLIPAAESMARDLGLQMHLNLINNIWYVTVGIFNGNGANLKKHNSAHFLYTLRSGFNSDVSKKFRFQLGTSIMYRYDDNYILSVKSGNDGIYTGNDFRFGFDARIILYDFEIQAEYIRANFNGITAHGYYAYVNFNFTPKDQFVLLTEQLIDLNNSTDDKPWLKTMYNHLFAKHKLKLMISGGTQFNNNYSASIQLQLFFH